MSKQRQQPSDAVFEKGLPSAVDAEKFVIGSVFLDSERVTEVSLSVDDFSLQSHRTIWRRVTDLVERGERPDRVMVAQELLAHGEMESVGGLSYLVSLDDGLPRVPSVDGYVRTIRDKAALRRLAMTAQHVMNRAITGEESPDEILSGAERSFLDIGESRQKDSEGLIEAGDFLRTFPGGWNSFVDPSTRANGLPTGFVKFDEMTGGLRPAELIILAARPGVGKSGLAGNIAWNVAGIQNIPVAMFALEMSTESLLLRMICAAARVDSQRLRSGYLNSGEKDKIRRAANQMADCPLYIDDASHLSLMDIRAKISKLEKKINRKPGLVVIDFLQLMASQGKQENRNQEVSRNARGLKLLSKDLGCPFLVLSQLNRASEARTGDKRPQLSDLKDSGGVEENADIVAALYRPELHKMDREDLRGVAELNILKQRSGALGRIDLTFIHSIVRFENRAEDLGDVPQEGNLPYADR